MRKDQMPSHSEMVKNIRAAYDMATATEVADGVAWYGEANAIAHSIAEKSGVELWQAIELIAIASPAADWSVNVKIPALILEGSTDGLFLTKWDKIKVEKVLAGESGVNGPKTRAFAQNIGGNLVPVTIDGWMVRIAIGDPGLEWKHTAICKSVYENIALAVTEVATELRLFPAHLQAVCWVAFRNRYKGKSAAYRKQKGQLELVVG